MLFSVFNFVYSTVHVVTCHANGFAACGVPLQLTGFPPYAEPVLFLLLALGSELVLLLALGSLQALALALSSELLLAQGLVLGAELVLMLVYAIWNWGYRQGSTGSTIGKSVLKFTVVSEKTGQPIGFGRSVVRELAHIVDWIIFYIGYLFPLWDARRRTLADMIMSTVCLATPTPQPRADEVRRKVKVGLIALAVVILAAAAGITGYLLRQPSTTSPPTSQTQTAQPAYGPQVTLPFTGLNNPVCVAVDAAGDLYVADGGNNRVVKLAAGSATQVVLPFTGLKGPQGVAVDTAGDVYVTDLLSDRVLEGAAGSATPTVLPFTGLHGPAGVAVDAAGNLYVTDEGNKRVLKLAAGSSTQSVLPFTGLHDPIGVAVDAGSNLYVTDFRNSQVLKLAAGSSTPTELPFTGLNHPDDEAVDTTGNLYVTDTGNNRVLKLPAG
jgi:DNA-binding beta-propeller fold protein YncE